MTKQDMLKLFRELDEKKARTAKDDEFELPLFDITDSTEKETEINAIVDIHMKGQELSV